jgi:hypothetical protein
MWGRFANPPLQQMAAFTLPHGTPLNEAERFAITASLRFPARP